ncbi:histone-lysine N-methyltransferase SETMAR [Trichonephila clavipes]|nr:histone-lysine N-methyltransferase SETMAR [Trichonephila clavipes]
MGHGSRVVKVSDCGLPCHEFESSTTKDPPLQNANQTAEIVIGAYGADTGAANYAQFWFRRFHSGIFDVKCAPRTGRPVVENVCKITEIINVDRYASSRSIAQELKIDHKTVLKHLREAGFKKKLDVCVCVGVVLCEFKL